MKAFLGEIVGEKEFKALRGGRLTELLEPAFEVSEHEAHPEDKLRLKELEQQSGLKPGMTAEQREAMPR